MNNDPSFFNRLSRFFPFLNWPRPTAQSLGHDAWAGLSVALVLIPQALAYATLAGMPPQTGLYAALIPSVIGILWGSSALLAVGPVALTSLLVVGSLTPLATAGTADWVVLAIWLSLYAGLIQFLLGACRLGRIASLVSQPVIVGFINAAALIIILSQLPALLGLHFSPAMLTDPLRAIQSAPAALVTATFGCTALLLLFLFKRYASKYPAILLVSALGIVASWRMEYAAYGAAIVGHIPAGLPPLAMPSAIPFSLHQALWPAALIIALISFTEAMSSCRVIARKTGEDWDENQELIGQGLAKMSSAFSGAFPVSGSFSRSALNLYAGAVSAWSTLFTALCVVLSLYFLTDLIAFMPRSVLAAMIIVPVCSLIDLAAIKRLLVISKDDGLIAIATLGTTLLTAPHLHWGVFTGVGLSLVSFLYRRTHPRIIEVAQHPDGTFRDRGRFDLPPIAPDVFAIRIDSALNFLTCLTFERRITESYRQNKQIKRVLFCAGSVNDIDASGIDTLIALRDTLERNGISFFMCAVKQQVWDVMDKSGYLAMMGSERIFLTDSDAIAALRSR